MTRPISDPVAVVLDEESDKRGRHKSALNDCRSRVDTVVETIVDVCIGVFCD